MLYLTDLEVDAALSYGPLIAALKQMHAIPTETQQDMLLEQPSKTEVTDRWLIRAAWQRQEALGIKLATIFPNNNSLGLPSIYAAYVLFDGQTGKPAAVMDGTVLTWRKTAADSALGAQFLARKDVANMLMVGAGAMAPEAIRAHLTVRPGLQRISIWNRNPARAVVLAEELSRDLDSVQVCAVDNLEAATRTADLICCATMSKDPLICGEWLQPGCHLDLIGAYTPDMREADDQTLTRGRLFVDSRATTIGHIGEIMIPMANGVLQESEILADHFELCQGRHPGRESEEEITVFKNGGGGHLDLMTARHVLARVDNIAKQS